MIGKQTQENIYGFTQRIVSVESKKYLRDDGATIVSIQKKNMHVQAGRASLKPIDTFCHKTYRGRFDISHKMKQL